MNWKIIDKNKRVQKEGVYTDWKEQIADDCYKQCVYCAIGEEPWGGLDHYHIDHYKPVSVDPDLENVITNLYLACPICNRFKSAFWLQDTKDLNLPFIPDPSDFDYSTLFQHNEHNKLIGLYPAANFIIERLYLNRPQLVHHRRELSLELKAKTLILEALVLAEATSDIEQCRKLGELSMKLNLHLWARRNVRPYKLSEIRKVEK